MKILVANKELEFDISSPETVRAFSAAENRMHTELPKTESLAERDPVAALEKQAVVMETFFDEAFGEGTAQSLFDGKRSLRAYFTAYKDIAMAAAEQQKQFEELVADVNRLITIPENTPPAGAVPEPTHGLLN